MKNLMEQIDFSFSNFWEGMVKNDHGLSVHETLRSAVS